MNKKWVTKNRYQIEFKDGSIKRIHADEYEEYSTIRFYRYYLKEDKIRPSKYQVASFDEDDVKNIILLDEDYPVEEVREPYITDGHIKDKPILLLALQKIASDMRSATYDYIDADAPNSKSLQIALKDIDSIIECVREMQYEDNK